MKQHNFLGHPKGLFLLFTTEMWERMCYYGMKGIFVLYLTSASAIAVFGWDQLSPAEQQANALHYLSIYGFLAYISPVLGGWVADNYWGQRKSIIVGGLLMALGQFSLAIPHHTIPGLEHVFLVLGLTLLIIGTGFFKPNISTMVGDLYAKQDQRRDSAYTVFYMGVNIGSILGYILVGGIGEKVAYQYGFLAAGIGMLIGVAIQLLFAQRYIGNIGIEPAARIAKRQTNLTFQPLTQIERDRIKVMLVLGFFTVFFWTGFEQAAGSMNLFAKNHTDLFVFGWEMPASWLQSINPILIIALAPMLATVWIGLGDREPNSPSKFSLGLLFLGIGFIFMVGAALQVAEQPANKASILWLVCAYFFHTLGELCLSPIGLSMVSRLAPLKYTSLMMGLWYFFIGFGNLIAGQLGKMVGTHGALNTFAGVAFSSVVAAMLLYMFNQNLIDWMHGAEPKATNNDQESQLQQELAITADHQGMSEKH